VAAGRPLLSTRWLSSERSERVETEAHRLGTT
jgi:hypothetical protein